MAMKMGQSCFIITDSFDITVFTRISAAMLIKIVTSQMWCLFEGLLFESWTLQRTASFQLPILFHFMTETSFGFDCIGAAQLIWGEAPINSVFLSQMRHLFEGGAYSSKYGILP